MLLYFTSSAWFGQLANPVQTWHQVKDFFLPLLCENLFFFFFFGLRDSSILRKGLFMPYSCFPLQPAKVVLFFDICKYLSAFWCKFAPNCGFQMLLSVFLCKFALNCGQTTSSFFAGRRYIPSKAKRWNRLRLLSGILSRHSAWRYLTFAKRFFLSFLFTTCIFFYSLYLFLQK